MFFRTILLSSPFLLGLSAFSQAQTASGWCPNDIDARCLAAIADHVIENETDIASQRRMALRYADILLSKAPAHAARLADQFSEGADWRSLRRIADSFADAGQTEKAAELIWASVEARAQDPDPNTKVLDMLLMGEDAADIGRLDLSRRIHGATVPHLPGELDGFVPLSDEMRVARLMALYGWPEDARPIVKNAYALARSIPQDSMKYGFTLTRMITVSVLTEQDALRQKVEADIASILATATPKVQNQVQRAHVTGLFEAGDINGAIARAADYGLSFDPTVQNVPYLFLQSESDYFPGIPEDTLRRFDAMFAAVKSPVLKAKFLENLASIMIQNDHFDGLESLLDRVEDPEQRVKVVLKLMEYHARERKDAKAAADLYFAKVEPLVQDLRSMARLLKSYPVSLTATGLLKQGDLARGGRLADVVLVLWASDTTDRRRVPTLLVSALAQAGDESRVKTWLIASDDANHKLEVLSWTLRGQIEVGQFGGRDAIRDQMEALLLQISDEKREPPSYWPANRPFLSLRGEARREMSRLDAEVVRALAENERLSEAQAAFANLDKGLPYPMRAHLAIADAMTRAGDAKNANAFRRDLLDMQLNGTLESSALPYVIKAMHP